jgi:FtsH-binding integral membrane protein
MQPELQPVRSNESAYGTRGAAISAESQRVLRNTYLLLALTMVPTIAGAFIGIATAPIVLGSPILS